jgi:hypothetical protein
MLRSVVVVVVVERWGGRQVRSAATGPFADVGPKFRKETKDCEAAAVLCGPLLSFLLLLVVVLRRRPPPRPWTSASKTGRKAKSAVSATVVRSVEGRSQTCAPGDPFPRKIILVMTPYDHGRETMDKANPRKGRRVRSVTGIHHQEPPLVSNDPLLVWTHPPSTMSQVELQQQSSSAAAASAASASKDALRKEIRQSLEEAGLAKVAPEILSQCT